MNVVIVILAAYALLGAYELIPLYKEKQWRDFWVTAGLGGMSLAMAVLINLHVQLPSPAQPIREFVTALFKVGS